MKHSLALVTALPALLLGGCYVESETVYLEHDPYYGPDPTYTCESGIPVAAVATIEADATMETNPGEESGLYVEYLAGGLWLIYTTCGDVDLYGPCTWEIETYVPECHFVGAEGYELDGEDSWAEYVETDELGAWATLYTDYFYDGFYVQTRPGAALQLDAQLDDRFADSYIFWVEDGSVRHGAPALPIEFVPDVP
jgi:hypothetical protein